MGLIDTQLIRFLYFVRSRSILGLVGYAILLTVTYLVCKLLYWYFFQRSANPFSKSCVRPRGPFETDEKKRDAVIKQGFTKKKIPDNLDAIVIGSGIGGLSTAAILSKAGMKVLVLEQHDQAGGCCHTFVEKGFEFDVGIHYVGKLAKGMEMRTLLDQITDGQNEWVEIEEEVMDRCMIGDPTNPVHNVPYVAGKDAWSNVLKKEFPNESAAIDKFFADMKAASTALDLCTLLKMIPRWVASLLIKTGLVAYLTDIPKFTNTTLRDYLKELTKDEGLRTVIAYSWGDYGTPPRSSPVIMQMTLHKHFQRGGYYPYGGASEVAFTIIPVIERSGGKVLVRADVSKILVDHKGTAVGVSVRKGGEEIDIHAPTIISAAGVINTYTKLLPGYLCAEHRLTDQLLTKVDSGVGAISVFVGLEGTAEENNLKQTNMWALREGDIDDVMEEFMGQRVEDVGTEDVPLMFVSFPCTKDPTWKDRFPGRSNCTIITLGSWEWFAEWKDGKIKKRGDDYDDIKNRIADRVWKQTVKLFPQLEGKKVFIDVGTPLTNNYYIGSPKGEIYGLDHNINRFNVETSALHLRAESPISGLYLTGQDTLTCGFSGALYSGVLTASAILNRNLLFDLMALNKEINADMKKNKSD